MCLGCIFGSNYSKYNAFLGISRYFFGVVIGPDGEYLMVAEIGKGNIHRYWLECENAG